MGVNITVLLGCNFTRNEIGIFIHVLVNRFALSDCYLFPKRNVPHQIGDKYVVKSLLLVSTWIIRVKVLVVD